MLLSQAVPHLLAQIISGDGPINDKTRITVKCNCGNTTTVLSRPFVKNWKTKPEYKCASCTGPARRSKISAALKSIMQDPQRRAQISATVAALWADPEYRAKQQSTSSTLSAARWADPEYRAKQLLAKAHNRHLYSAISTALWADPEYRAKQLAIRADLTYVNSMAAAQAKPWADSEYRAKQSAIRSVPSYITRASAVSKAMWEDSEFRSKMADIYTEPEYKAKMIARCKAVWARPEYRAKFRALWQNAEYRTKMAIIRANQPRTSNIQLMLYAYLDNLNVIYDAEGANTTIGHYVFDCLIPSPDLTVRKHLLIECQGNYWHNLPKAIRNDKSKFTYIEKYFPEYEIMYIWEHEFGTAGRVLDRLKLKLGLAIDTINFRLQDVVLKEPTGLELKSFLDTYHYIGKDRGGITFGAYLNGLLIGAVVYSPPLRQNTASQFQLTDGQIRELSRFCIHPAYHKKNFASWLIARSLQSVSDARLIIAYADTTVGHTGTIYKAAGFKLHHEVPADYWYVDADGYVMHKRTLYGKAIKMQMTEHEFSVTYGFVKQYGGQKLCYIRCPKINGAA